MNDRYTKKWVPKTLLLLLTFLLVFHQGAMFNIENAYAAIDVTKPTFKSVEVDKQEGTVGDTVKVSVDAEDGESGIKSVYAWYYMPITKKIELCTFNV